jgi:hypothetical protein
MTPEPGRSGAVRYGSRYGTEELDPVPPGRRCPICQTATVPARARYCSDACKQRAYRLRRAVDGPMDRIDRAVSPRRRQALVAHTVYECPACETRLLGTQRCPDCHVFCRRLGLGGPCPHCDEPILVADLLPPEVLP